MRCRYCSACSRRSGRSLSSDSSCQLPSSCTTSGNDRIEETAREFADRFGDGAFESAAALLTENGRERTVEYYPDEFRDGSLTAEDVLEQYWWGLYGQYGDFDRVGDVAIEDGEAAVELDYADGSEVASVDVEGGGVAALSFSPGYEAPTMSNVTRSVSET